MKPTVASTSILILLSAISGAVFAQNAAGIVQNSDEEIKAIYTAPVAGIPIRLDNGIFVYGALQIGVGQNSNVRATETDVRSSSTLGLRPNVVAEVKKGADRYTLSYLGNYTSYSRDNNYNFDHHDLTIAGDKYFTARSRMALAAGVTDRTDDPGATTNAQSDSVDRWTGRNVRGLFAYGADGAQGRLELEGGMGNKRYKNNLANTAGSDLDNTSVSGRFYWRVMPNTYATAELRRYDNDYRIASSTNDNIDTRALVGLTWDVTRITSGTIKVGQQRKNYNAREDVDTATYEAQLSWAPRTYSLFTVNARRAEDDATNVGSSIANTQYSLDWAHKWTESFSSNLVFGSGNADYRNSQGRVDDTASATLGLKYELTSNLGLSVDLTRTERDSNTPGFDFKRNTVFAAVQVAL